MLDNNPRVPQIYTLRGSVHLRDRCISIHPPLPIPSPRSLCRQTPAIGQSSAKMKGGGSQKWIFPPQRAMTFSALLRFFCSGTLVVRIVLSQCA